MSIYSHVRRSGPIRSKMTKAHILRTAQRFGMLRLPRSANNVFDRLRTVQARRGITMPTAPILAVPQPLLMTPGTTYTRMTDQQKAAITGGSPLIRNLLNPSGIAAPAQFAGQQATTSSGNPNYQYVADFKTEWIDDRQWGAGNTLPELLGSGMLNQTQLRKASINNILSLFDFEGGTEQERLEMGYILQRFVIEGMVRGVDVLDHVQKDNTTNNRKLIIRLGTVEDMKYKDAQGVEHGAAGLSYGDQADGWTVDKANRVLFGADFWRGCSDQHKLSVFTHEFGHQLLNWADSDYYYGIKNPADTSPAGFNDYFGHTFAEGPLGSKKSFDYKVGADNPVITDPTTLWGMPQVGGKDVGDPNEPPITGNETFNTTTTTSNVTVAPTTVTPYAGAPAQFSASAMGGARTPDDIESTPVAGMLPQLPGLFTFQAGLQDTMRRSSKMLNGLAGSLLTKGA